MVTELDLMSVFQLQKGLILRCPFFSSRETNGFLYILSRFNRGRVNFEELPNWQIFENFLQYFTNIYYLYNSFLKILVKFPNFLKRKKQINERTNKFFKFCNPPSTFDSFEKKNSFIKYTPQFNLPSYQLFHSSQSPKNTISAIYKYSKKTRRNCNLILRASILVPVCQFRFPCYEKLVIVAASKSSHETKKVGSQPRMVLCPLDWFALCQGIYTRGRWSSKGQSVPGRKVGEKDLCETLAIQTRVSCGLARKARWHSLKLATTESARAAEGEEGG